jgi:AcrR family transcriptional regulator
MIGNVDEPPERESEPGASAGTGGAGTGVARAPLSGRRAQALTNDQRILDAARRVFLDDPEAPVSAVAKEAGVGISALYRRYPSKEDLLRTLCGEGLRTYIQVVEEALADDREPWVAFTRYMERAVESDTSSLVQHLAGTFTPTPDMWTDAVRANQLSDRLFDRFFAAGILRRDIEANDIALILEQLASIHLGDRERTMALRRRYLAVVLDGLRSTAKEPLPGSPPSWEEISQRWNTG